MALRTDELELGQRTPLAKGGMARVYDLSDFRVGEQPDLPLVYKRYKKFVRPVPLFGLEYMVKLRDTWHPDQRRVIDRSFNWMLRVVTDDSPGAAGVILPRLDNSYFARLTNSYGELMVLPAEGVFLAANSAYFTQARMSFPTVEERLTLCRSLAKGMGLLHRAKVVYGDLSLRNFLYRLRPVPSVIYVDTDNMRPEGSTAALGNQPHTPDWEPPESLHARRRGDSIGFATQNYETDLYKLGLAILRVLAVNVPRAAERRDPTLAQKLLPASLYRLLEASLTAPPTNRPSAKTWYEEFH